MPLVSLVSSADDSDCRTSHPIFGISSPSVEIDGIPKSSGIHNLSRQGWNEDKCRKFLIRQGFIPRNFKYKDGLKLLHPLLQEAFGDENMDLAIGVFEELVEIDSDFPFPGCVYRSWKHDHLKRHEDYQLPHVPHTSTITHSIKPTEALIEWRAQQAYNFSMSGLHHNPRHHRPGSHTNTPNPLSSEVRTSSTASLKSAFRIEYGTFISVGGRKATILACPTAEQFHQNLWNPAFGRGGRYVGVRDININEDAALSKIKAPLQSKPLVPLNILKLRKKVEKCLSVDSQPAGAIFQTRAWFIPRNRKVPEGKRVKLAVRHVSLPPGAIISGAFARKNALVGEDEDLPDSLLLALKLPTADDIANQRIEQRFSDARTMVDKLGTIGDLSEHSKKLLESYFINLNLETFKALPTPNLFLDSILDYKWDCALPDREQREGLIDLTNAGNITLNKSLNFPLAVATSSDELDVSSDSGRSAIIDIYMQDEIFKPRLSSYGQGNTAPQETRKLSEQEPKKMSALDYIEPKYDETTPTSSGMNGGLQLSSFNQTSDTDFQILEPKTYCPSQKNPKLRMALENELSGGSTCKGASIQGHRIESKSIINRKKCAERTPARDTKLGQHSLYGFDGASDDFYSVYPNTDNNKQTIHHSTIKPDAKNLLILATINDSMELDLGASRLPPQSPSKPQPLHIRKQLSEAHMARGQQQLDQDLTYQEHCGGYLRRPSSTCNHVPMSNSHRSRASRSKTASGLDNSAQSSLSGHRGQHYSGEYSIDVASTVASTAQSTVSSCKQGYLSNSTSEIMGDFVPINPFDVVSGPATSDDGKAVLHSSTTARKFPKVINPYEFEPSTPGNDNTRQTVTKIFNSQDDLFVSSPKVSHVKNSRSGGHTLYTTRSPSPVLCTSKSTSCGIHRSESSPTVSPLRFEPYCERSPGSEFYCFHPGDDRLFSQYHHVPQLLGGRSRSGLQAERVEFASLSPPCLPTKPSTPSSPPRPSRMQQKESFYYENSRNPARSLTYMLENVFEQDELDIAKSAKSPSPPPVPPKKRARSPMKKMFGENGWLGQSPNEKPEPKFQSKKLFGQSNQNLHSRKKTTMIGKIKNKLEEIAEKADLSPIFKSDYEKYSKLAMLSISLPPPEQARIYMEVELMLVHTANNFLMGQFSQGRIDVDSIKKTVDSWKSKGRPLVIEFMYDQATQRELVIANQNNFRFHGPTAGSEVRIRSMLYNWKQVASLLSIRTFCSADTVITKLLFDTEQVLELLGAAEPLMLRLQQIRATANQNIRSARQNKEVKEAIQVHSHTRQIDLDARNPDGSVRYDPAKEEGYGGMKLVPDSYME